MEDTIILYHKNEIYLTEQDLKNYQKIYNVLSQGGQSIDSDLFNFINSDMNKSYNTNGYKNNNTDNF